MSCKWLGYKSTFKIYLWPCRNFLTEDKHNKKSLDVFLIFLKQLFRLRSITIQLQFSKQLHNLIQLFVLLFFIQQKKLRPKEYIAWRIQSFCNRIFGKKENARIWPYSRISEHYDNQNLSKPFKSFARINSISSEYFNYSMMVKRDTA